MEPYAIRQEITELTNLIVIFDIGLFYTIIFKKVITIQKLFFTKNFDEFYLSKINLSKSRHLILHEFSYCPMIKTLNFKGPS